MGIDRSSGQPDEEPDRPREEPRPGWARRLSRVGSGRSCRRGFVRVQTARSA